MARDEQNDKSMKTKLAQAEKYEKLAAEARNRSNKIQFIRKAEMCRRQATQILRT